LNINTKTLTVIFCLVLSSAHADDAQKIAYIQQHFDSQSRHSSLWQNGWLAVVGVNTVINAGDYKNAETNIEHVDAGTALAVSVLGLGSSIQRPMRIHHYANQLAALPSDSGTELSEKRRMAEQWLMEAANRESYEQSTKNRLTSGLAHGLAALIISAEGSGEDDAIASFISGMLFSELKIRTAPKRSAKALADYQQGLTESAAGDSNKPLWSVGFDGRRLTAQLLLY
jgi:hypothetical protein